MNQENHTEINTNKLTTEQPTPEEIAAAMKIMAKVNTPEESTNVSGPSDLPVKPSETPVKDEPLNTAADDQSPPEDEVTIDPVKKAKIEVLFTETINNPRFWAKENRYKALMVALVIPVFDDRSLQQFYNHSEDDLMAKAAKSSRDSGLPAILPTEEEIKTEAWSRYTEKIMAEEKKALVKKRKDDAKANGTRYVPVTDDDVRETVTDHVSKLRDQESG